MNFKANEWRLLTLVAVNGAQGQAVSVAALEPFFDRPVFLRHAVESLVRWGLLARDPFKGEVRLLGQAVLRALSVCPAAQGVLFQDERPLNAALASASAICAEPSPQAVPPDPGRVMPDAARVLLHAARVAQHAHVNVTSNRSDVETIKRSERGAPSAPMTTEDVVKLRQSVLAFVGPADFEKHWNHATFWRCDTRMRILERTIRYVKAGPATRTTPGRHLWAQFKMDCAENNIEPMYRLAK